VAALVGARTVDTVGREAVYRRGRARIVLQACNGLVRLNVVHCAPQADFNDYEGWHYADDLNQAGIQDDLERSVDHSWERRTDGTELTLMVFCLRNPRSKMIYSEYKNPDSILSKSVSYRTNEGAKETTYRIVIVAL
jgi:hypothetical protein